MLSCVVGTSRSADIQRRRTQVRVLPGGGQAGHSLLRREPALPLLPAGAGGPAQVRPARHPGHLAAGAALRLAGRPVRPGNAKGPVSRYGSAWLEAGLASNYTRLRSVVVCLRSYLVFLFS